MGGRRRRWVRSARTPGRSSPEFRYLCLMPDDDAVRAFFATAAYLDKNPILPIRAALVGELLAGVRDGWILDLGCGDGSISLPLLRHGNRLTLVDLSQTMLDRAKASAPSGAAVTFVQEDILAYLPERPYDAVLCLGVAAHVSSIERLFARASDAVRNGGVCVLQATDDSQPFGRLRKQYYRVRYARRGGRNETTLDDIIDLASRHELEIRTVRRYGLDLPGSGFLPYHWQLRIEAAALSSRALSLLSAEVLVCFEKRSTRSA